MSECDGDTVVAVVLSSAGLWAFFLLSRSRAPCRPTVLVFLGVEGASVYHCTTCPIVREPVDF